MKAGAPRCRRGRLRLGEGSCEPVETRGWTGSAVGTGWGPWPHGHPAFSWGTSAILQHHPDISPQPKPPHGTDRRCYRRFHPPPCLFPRSFAPLTITILPPGNKLKNSPNNRCPLIPSPAPASVETNPCWVSGGSGTIPCRSCHASCAALIALTRRKQNRPIILIAGRNGPQLPVGSEHSDAMDYPS